MKLSLASTGAESGTRFLDHVKLAELLGFHAFFHHDRKWGREVFSHLGAATQCTTKLGLGASLVDPYTRHPALLAQAAATLAEMAPNRFRVIMGVVGDFKTLPGYGSGNPVVALREAVDLMRALWRGETVTRDTEAFKFKSGALDWKPAAIPKLYVAAGESGTFQLAGNIADGVMTDFATAQGIEYAKQHIQTGLRASGRSRRDIKLCCYIPVTVLEHANDPIPDAIREAARSRKGVADVLDNKASGEALPRGLVDTYSLVGTSEELVERFKALSAADVEEIVLSAVLVPGQDFEDLMFKLAKDVLPHFV